MLAVTNVSGDRVPVAGEVWTNKWTGEPAEVWAVHNEWVWIQVDEFSRCSSSAAWVVDNYVPPRKVSRKIQLGRNASSGNVYTGSTVYQTDTHIGTVIVYDDNTIEVKYATD